MSGHSKWSKIKRKKGENDARRGRLWSKIARKIIMATKAGGPNADENLTLRYAIDEGKAANMPNDTINNAIKKGSGELGSVNYEEVLYEGYGTGGIAVMAECLTDNRNRTAPEMRKIFERAGGQLATSGAVAWMFQKKGTFTISTEVSDEDTVMEVALEAGAEDVVAEDDSIEVTCSPAAFGDVKQAFADAGIEVEESGISQVAENPIIAADLEQAQKVMRLLEALDSHDDVQEVYTNIEIPEELASQLE